MEMKTYDNDDRHHRPRQLRSIQRRISAHEEGLTYPYYRASFSGSAEFFLAGTEAYRYNGDDDVVVVLAPDELDYAISLLLRDEGMARWIDSADKAGLAVAYARVAYAAVDVDDGDGEREEIGSKDGSAGTPFVDRNPIPDPNTTSTSRPTEGMTDYPTETTELKRPTPRPTEGPTNYPTTPGLMPKPTTKTLPTPKPTPRPTPWPTPWSTKSLTDDLTTPGPTQRPTEGPTNDPTTPNPTPKQTPELTPKTSLMPAPKPAPRPKHNNYRDRGVGRGGGGLQG